MIKHLKPREFSFPDKGISLVCYDGSYPNLCSGTLIIAVDGKVWSFPSHALVSGGSVSFDEVWNEQVVQGEWMISDWPEGFPEEMKEDTLQIINAEISWGCCGGCV